MKVKRGATRNVLLAGRFAFKFPSCRSWRLFLNGLLGNMQEAEFARAGWPKLCPVVFSLPYGFLTVMRRAEPLPDDVWRGLDVQAWASEEGHTIPVEPKQDSFGVLDGRIVAVDYGS